MSRLPLAILFATCLLSGCGSSVTRTAKTYPSGDKATVGPLIYNVVDVHIAPRLGDDPANSRLPQNRFFLVRISASNSSTADVTIPALTLIDDRGTVYNEIADGTNVPDWLGIIRKVEPGLTSTGVVVFDAPSQHYRLRLTDETEEDIGIDIPLTYVNETVAPAIPPADAGQTQVPAKR